MNGMKIFFENMILQKVFENWNPDKKSDPWPTKKYKNLPDIYFSGVQNCIVLHLCSNGTLFFSCLNMYVFNCHMF